MTYDLLVVPAIGFVVVIVAIAWPQQFKIPAPTAPPPPYMLSAAAWCRLNQQRIDAWILETPVEQLAEWVGDDGRLVTPPIPLSWLDPGRTDYRGRFGLSADQTANEFRKLARPLPPPDPDHMETIRR